MLDHMTFRVRNLAATRAFYESALAPLGYKVGFQAEHDGVRMFGHGGGAPGMNGDLRVYPAQGRVVVALANVDPPAAERLVDYYLLRMPATTPVR